MPKEQDNTGLTKASDVLPFVIESLGIEQNIKIEQIKEIWSQINSEIIAKNSTPAYLDKENKLVIYVTSAVLSTELSMQKTSLLNNLKKHSKNIEVEFKDIRFVPRTNIR